MILYNHKSIMTKEIIKALSPISGGLYIDCTLGGGGHSRAILEASAPDGKLIAIDRDIDALEAGKRELKDYQKRVTFVNSQFGKLAEISQEYALRGVQGILMDIGVSSYQLDEQERGFSYNSCGPLDMRMDRRQHLTAQLIVNTYTVEELTDIFYKYGEEKWAKRIAEFILESRRQLPIASTEQLVEIIRKAVPKGARDKTQHPAKRVFQALRIEVNGELKELERGLEAAVSLLTPGGKIAIITFHSLEDRIVKEKFKYLASKCVCPPSAPVCTCGKKAELKIITKKPILPEESEIADNPRARSAKLRIAEKLDLGKF